MENFFFFVRSGQRVTTELKEEQILDLHSSGGREQVEMMANLSLGVFNMLAKVAL